MKINIANTTKSDLELLFKLLGVRYSNEKNIFNTQLIVLRDGNWKHAGNVDFPLLSLKLDEIEK